MVCPMVLHLPLGPQGPVKSWKPKVLALNVTTENRKNGKINMAYGFLGDNKEQVPVYPLPGEGALAEVMQNPPWSKTEGN